MLKRRISIHQLINTKLQRGYNELDTSDNALESITVYSVTPKMRFKDASIEQKPTKHKKPKTRKKMKMTPIIV